jgi:hypothetical protein
MRTSRELDLRISVGRVHDRRRRRPQERQRPIDVLPDDDITRDESMCRVCGVDADAVSTSAADHLLMVMLSLLLLHGDTQPRLAIRHQPLSHRSRPILTSAALSATRLTRCHLHPPPHLQQHPHPQPQPMVGVV